MRAFFSRYKVYFIDIFKDPFLYVIWFSVLAGDRSSVGKTVAIIASTIVAPLLLMWRDRLMP